MSEEIWKPVVGYEGLYEVSDMGRVRTLLVKTRCRNDGGILNQQKATNGYRLVCLTKDGRDSARSVHRIVASAFCKNDANKPTVNHINGDRKDNRLENLEWATMLEQSADARRRNGIWCAHGDDHESSVLTSNRVTLIRSMYASGAFPQWELGTIFGVKQMAVSRAIRRITWARAA